MKSFGKSSITALLCAGTALTSLAALPALAQTQNQETASEGAMLGEIVVTARRRAESLQDVPVSISAFSAEQLENMGTPDITSLTKTTPNLTMQVARGSNSTLIAFIRGVGQQDPLWGFEPGVGLYVDDVYVARPQGAVLDIFDIERIEVLRGPQGTLYGRNTIGGAVKYVTKRIDDEPHMKAKVQVGSYKQTDLILSGSAPVTENVGVSGAVALYRRDGYGKNLTTGQEHYDKDVSAGRLSVEFKPNEDLFIRVAADKTVDDSNPRHGYRLLPTPAATPPVIPVLDSVYDTRAGLTGKQKVKNQGASGTIEYNVSDSVMVKSITAYRDGRSDTVIDFDNLPAKILDIPAYYKDDQFSEELQLVYEGERLKGVAGLYYMDAHAEGAFDTIVGLANLTTLTSGSVDTKSYAAFADFSYELTDQVKASVGARYTSDKKTGTVYRVNYAGLTSPLFGGTPRNPTLIRSDYTNQRTFDEFTPRVSLTYEPTRDFTLYASYGRGFKSGGFDMRGDVILTPDTRNGYDPELVDTYEVGSKSRFWDGRATLNLAAFYSDYKGQQVTTQVPSGTTIASFVDNVGSSTIKGLEAEGLLAITDELTANFAVGYIDAEFKEFLRYNLTTRQYDNIANTAVFQNTPKWTANFGLTYTRDLGDAGIITLTGNAAHRSAFSMFEFRNAALDQDGYTLYDLSAVWTAASDNWSVGVHGKNLGNKKYRVGGYNFPGATFADSVIGYYGPPRTVTATVEYRF
ncbi:TonB-dependent receptor [Niveispirillum sp.]|uniref:TonB-dependent receptor n=1 Tax=Niveispirillum sp. TaxID=1917217 RepID=UPI001B739D20|nr:TonB-dependent receptor [Niveispirillum sp.]MBP7334779.1 TonB-dependent receptor [Niveispirillum sp.]